MGKRARRMAGIAKERRSRNTFTEGDEKKMSSTEVPQKSPAPPWNSCSSHLSLCMFSSLSGRVSFRGSSRSSCTTRTVFMMLTSALSMPGCSTFALPAFDDKIEKTPWFAVRIAPTLLPESDANRSADARALRVASVIMSGLDRVQAREFVDEPAPIAPSLPFDSTMPACSSWIVFCAAAATVSTFFVRTVMSCCTM